MQLQSRSKLTLRDYELSMSASHRGIFDWLSFEVLHGQISKRLHFLCRVK